MAETKDVQTPTLLWAERKDSLFVTIDVPDCKDVVIELTEDKLVFSANSNDKVYKIDMEFLKAVDAGEDSKYKVKDRNVYFSIMKKDQEEEEHWGRLSKDKAWGKAHCKCDWSKYVDEDEEDEAGAMGDTSDFSSMMGGGGGKGMGGMGGMGGMM